MGGDYAGIVKKINQQNTDFAQMENISFYLAAAKQLGLRETQLFTSKELYERNGRIRDVVISLYWLGRAARGVPTYKGPHLNLSAFHKLNCTKCKKPITDNNYLATMDSQYHRACAVCCKCKCQLDPKQPFYQAGNDIYCHNCMLSSSNVSAPSSAGPHSHGKGNNCHKCKRNLDGVDYVPYDDGNNYCLSCVCSVCRDPLKGNEKTIGGKKYCPDCLCSECTKPLDPDAGYFESDDGKKVCPPCANKPKHKQPSHGHPPSHSHAHEHQRGGPANSCPNCGTALNPNARFCPECGSAAKGGPATGNNNQGNKPQSSGPPGCQACDAPLHNKKKKHTGHDCDKYCDPCANDYCCAACGDEIVGQAIGALGKKYHPKCFNCTNCHVNLPGGKFQQINNEPYCNPCYDKCSGKFGFCAGCGDKLDRTAVQALGQNWHPKCFNCFNCHKGFPDGEYIEVDNKPYCADCAPKPGTCYACHKALSGEVANIFDKAWHKGCFVCTSCRKPFLKSYSVFQGLPYCEPCHLQLSADRCEGCGQPMVGEVVKAKNKQWHKRCFVCTTCKKYLAGTKESPDVFIKFSKPYCRDCNPGGTGGAAKFCSSCGTPSPGGNFCNACGARIN